MVKKAFNLAEMLLVLAIIGTISIISLQVTKASQNKDDYRKMYYTAYNALVQAAGNAALEWNPQCSCPEFENMSNDMVIESCWSQECWTNFEYDTAVIGNSVTKGVRRDYPGFLMGTPTIGNFVGYATDSYFCKLLTSKLNTINESVECQHFINSYAIVDKNGRTIDYSKGVNFKEAFCNKHLTKPSDYRNEVVTSCEFETQPSFITANGQRFYISKLLSANAATDTFKTEEGTNKINREFFRLVAVDLNGNSHPNTQLTKITGKLPDIVLFALRSNGSVIPLGLPEFNRNYASAIVQYPQFQGFDDSGNMIENPQLTSTAMTICDAKAKAWGVHDGAQVNGQAVDSNRDTAWGQVFSEMEPLSYSSMLYQMAISCGEATRTTSCPTEAYIDELLARLITQFTFKNDEQGKDNASAQRKKIIQNPTFPTADKDLGCSFRYSRCGVKIIEE